MIKWSGTRKSLGVVVEATHVGLGRGEAELNESDLGLLYAGDAGAHPLGQNQALHHLTIINGPSENTHTHQVGQSIQRWLTTVESNTVLVLF